MNLLTWLGICFCLSQSAMFSGLNLAFFSVTRLRLEVEASNHNPAARNVLKMRSDSHFLLTTILWGNVGVNVLLTLLSHSVMAGMAAFVFSTVIITLIGEIIPQAYFSRHALKIASFFAPLLKVYQVILFPVAKPSALLLDVWLGKENTHYFKENSLKQLIQKHIENAQDIDYVEGMGAINFLSIDDLLVEEEGEMIDPDSIITMKFEKGNPQFPIIHKSLEDPFIKKLHKSGRKWAILINELGQPVLVLDADGFIRSALLDAKEFDPCKFAHYPVIVEDAGIPLGEVIARFKTEETDPADNRIKKDVILLWGAKKQIITGSDILGRLLHGILSNPSVNPNPSP